MRGLFFASLICIVLCVQGTHAQWLKWVLEKGKTCEDRCRNKIKMCDPMAEFDDCKCFPQLIVDNWRQYHSLPIDPSVVCMYLMSSSKAPKCCNLYTKQKDFYKNSIMEMASRIGNQSQEIKELGEQNKEMVSRIGNLDDENKEMVSRIGNQSQEIVELGEQNKEMVSRIGNLDDENKEMASIIQNQNKETDQLKESLSNLTDDMSVAGEQDRNLIEQLGEQELEVEKLKQRLEEEHNEMSKETTDLVSTLAEQNKALESLKQAFAKEPWKQVEKKAAVTVCPHGWSQRGAQCYKVYETELNWHECERLCELHNAYMASIESAAEQSFIGGVLAGTGGDVWLGGTDEHSEGNWVWHHTNTAFRYTNWYRDNPSQPNDSDGTDNCLYAWPNQDFKWGDIRCSGSYRCLCEKTLG